MYLDEKEKPILIYQNGRLAVGVPWFGSGCFTRNRIWKLQCVLIQPAIDLATKCFKLTEREFAQWKTREDFSKTQFTSNSIYQKYSLEEKDILGSKELAQTLKLIQNN